MVSSFISNPDPNKYEISLDNLEIRVNSKIETGTLDGRTITSLEDTEKIAQVVISKLELEPKNEFVRASAQLLINQLKQKGSDETNSAIVGLLKEALKTEEPESPRISPDLLSSSSVPSSPSILSRLASSSSAPASPTNLSRLDSSSSSSESPITTPRTTTTSTTSAQSIDLHRKTLDENIEILKREFREGLFIRTFSDPVDEYEITIKPKLAIETQSDKIDKRYWASSSTLQEGCHLPIWNPTGNRIGLFISAQAKVGGWNIQDMGTDNPTPKMEDERIKNYFPNNFPDIAFAHLSALIEKRDPEIIRKLLNLDESTPITMTEAQVAQDFLLLNLDREAENHALLLERVPDKFKSAYDMESIQRRMKDLAAHQGTGILSDYSESKVRYTPNDIVGIFVNEKSEKSIQDGAELQAKLARDGLRVPLVTYGASDGSIQIYRTKEELPKAT